jgi:acyl dehydratase
MAEPESYSKAWQPPFAIGEQFTRELVFDRQTIKQFATLAMDPNPLHLDDDFAARSRFGDLIASGTQSMSWVLGSLGGFVNARCNSLGLEFDFKLRRAVPADCVAVVAWTVVSLTAKASLNGHIMVLKGELRDQSGEAMVTANAKILVLADFSRTPAP